MIVVVHAGGYVGLTGAIHLALTDTPVIIYDPDQSVVDALNSGKPKAQEFLGYIGESVDGLLKKGLLKATTDYDSVKYETVHLIAVPTEKDDEPYLAIVKKAVVELSWSAPPESLIIIESTLQPGTIDEILRVSNRSQYLAVCPRLDWLPDRDKNLTNLPRIVGGVDDESTERAAAFLSRVCKEIHKTNYRVAEMAKAMQNHLYHTQIMAAYQVAEHYQDFVDMNEVLKYVSLHWRLPNLYLGPGSSGRCVNMGSKYILKGGDLGFYSFSRQAVEYDEKWREKVADVFTRKFNFPESEKAQLLVMGIAYRPNFSDFGYSAGLDIAEYLDIYSWNVSIHDPIVSRETIGIRTNVTFKELGPDIDGILLATAHDQYLKLPENVELWKRGQRVLDATGAWEKYRDLFKQYGVNYIRVGEKGWMDK